ncbi:MAG: lysophospholipid acyltransferase family protein [Gammaproteobacteria bacterium]|nr:lysophospholipid acyltransferase family protein [Gammaproteobacteria bacterium]MDJ0870186.1 lysophospholipid acyltransferase family protein [Gammaproteobacteria bacterium]MDJ0890674.1 lysophospholipid acyltransferase family protein [Gammaproteobacteria bacterium]
MNDRLPEHQQAEPGVLTLYARSALFVSGLWLSTGVFALLLLLTFPLPYRWRSRFVLQWTRLNLWSLRNICKLGYELEGVENIPEHPTIVMSKHQSAWETLALQTLFQPQVWVLKRELLWIPVFGWGLAIMKPIAIDRKSGRRAVRQVVQQGRRRLVEGCWVMIFPEGTRVAPGTRLRYRIGGAVLAEESGFSVVPVAHNAGEFWPRRSFIKRPGTIRVVIGAPIPSESRSAPEIIRQVEEWIEGTMGRISQRV